MISALVSVVNNNREMHLKFRLNHHSLVGENTNKGFVRDIEVLLRISQLSVEFRRALRIAK